MRKFVGVLFQILGLALQGILLFALVIVGTDLINRYIDDKKADASDSSK